MSWSGLRPPNPTSAGLHVFRVHAVIAEGHELLGRQRREAERVHLIDELGGDARAPSSRIRSRGKARASGAAGPRCSAPGASGLGGRQHQARRLDLGNITLLGGLLVAAGITGRAVGGAVCALRVALALGVRGLVCHGRRRAPLALLVARLRGRRLRQPWCGRGSSGGRTAAAWASRGDGPPTKEMPTPKDETQGQQDEHDREAPGGRGERSRRLHQAGDALEERRRRSRPSPARALRRTSPGGRPGRGRSARGCRRRPPRGRRSSARARCASGPRPRRPPGGRRGALDRRPWQVHQVAVRGCGPARWPGSAQARRGARRASMLTVTSPNRLGSRPMTVGVCA